MSQTITITGKTLTAGSAQTLDLSALYLPLINSILKAELIINSHQHAAISVASTLTTPELTHAGSAVADHSTGALLDLVAAHTVTQPSAHAAGGVIAGNTCASHQHAAGQPTRTALTIVTSTPTGVEEIQRVDDYTLSMWLTANMTVNDVLILAIEERGSLVRP